MFGPLFVQVLGLYEHRRAALGGQSGAVSGGRWWWMAFGTVQGGQEGGRAGQGNCSVHCWLLSFSLLLSKRCPQSIVMPVRHGPRGPRPGSR